MSDPILLSNPGQISGIYIRFGELARRVASLEAARGFLNGIDGGMIAPGTINGGSITPGTITTGAIAAGAITSDLILAGAIDAGHIQAGSIGAGHISALAINAIHIGAEAIQAGHIQTGSITSTHIAAGTITAQDIATGTITATQIAAGTITATQIAAGTITATQIAAGTITATELAANSISATHIQANAVTASEISANSIYSAAIQAGAVTADKVTVSALSAITSNLGSMTAGTITGGTIQTAASGSRVVMDSLGLRGFSLDGVTKVFEINAGSGIASFTGVAYLDPTSVVPSGALDGTISGLRLPPIGGTNLLANSSFENTTTPLSGWELTSTLSVPPTIDVISLGSAPFGTKVARLTNSSSTTGRMGTVNNTTNRPGVRGGRSYTLSAYGQPASGSASFRVYVDYINSTGGVVGSANALVSSPAAVWTRASVTSVAPSTAVKAITYAWSENPTANQVFYIDGLQLEEGDIATAYAPLPSEILPGTIGTTELQDSAVTDAKVAGVAAVKVTGQITGTQITDSAISTPKLAAGSVTTAKVVAGAITATEIATGAIIAGKIAANAVTATTIEAGAVTTEKMTANTINGDRIQAGTLTAAKIVSASITTTQMAAGAITTNILAAGAVTAGKLTVEWGGNNMLFDSGFAKVGLPNWTGVNATIASVTGHQRAGSPNTKAAQLTSVAAGNISIRNSSSTQRVPVQEGKTYTGSAYFKGATSRICRVYLDWYNAAGARITVVPGANVSNASSQYVRGSVTETAPAAAVSVSLIAEITSVAGASEVHYVSDVQVEPGEIVTGYARMPGEILPGEVGATQITPNSITTNEIMASTIQGSNIAASTIAGLNIVGSTITADKLFVSTLSAITADMGAITAGTITGAVVRTSANTTRVQMDSTGVFALQNNVPVFRLNATSGVITQGKRAVASNQVELTASGPSVGPEVTIAVDSDVSLVHIYVEAEIRSEIDTVSVMIEEATDFSPALRVIEGGAGNVYEFRRTMPGSNFGTTSKFAGYISYRPTVGTRTYHLRAQSPIDAANQTFAYIRNRMIHVYTT